jgi:hypothetical protein
MSPFTISCIFGLLLAHSGANPYPYSIIEVFCKFHATFKYKKVTHGKEFFDKLDPEVAYQKCSRLKDLLDDMLKMAKEAGL